MARSFAGAGTAIVTPFTPSGELDEPALRRLLRRQIEARIDVLVPCGTTGESATMTAAERNPIRLILEPWPRQPYCLPHLLAFSQALRAPEWAQ